MKQGDLRLCLSQSFTVSLGTYWTEYEWLVLSHRWIIDLGHQVPQVYKLCSILMTGLTSQAWTTGGMYTTIYTTARLPPAWSQINPAPHPETWMLCVPCAAHCLSWAGADGWWADTPPKPWAPIYQQPLRTWGYHSISGIKLLHTCFDTSQQVKLCFSCNNTGWRKDPHMVMLHRFQISCTYCWFKNSSCNTPFCPVSNQCFWLPFLTNSSYDHKTPHGRGSG